MRPLLRLLAILLLVVAAQPVLAHGTEKHSEATAEHADNPPTKAGADVGGQPAGATAGAEHDEHAGSVWTKLHPATVHFPIALLLMAALTELLTIARPSPGLLDAVRVMAWGGAVGAIVAAAFGWIHTGLWLGGDTTMQWHRWTGTSLAIVAPVAALLSSRANRVLFRALLFLIAVILLAQGYWGGELAHDPNHLGI